MNSRFQKLPFFSFQSSIRVWFAGENEIGSPERKSFQSEYEKALDSLSSLITRRICADGMNKGDQFDLMLDYLKVVFFFLALPAHFDVNLKAPFFFYFTFLFVCCWNGTLMNFFLIVLFGYCRYWNWKSQSRRWRLFMLRALKERYFLSSSFVILFFERKKTTIHSFKRLHRGLSWPLFFFFWFLWLVA